jgi:hypothetical protein
MKKLLSLLLVSAIPVFAAAQCSTTVSVSSSDASSIICAGTSVTLTASGTSIVSWSWSNGATTSSITVSPTSATDYSVTGTDNSGCTGTADITLNIDNPSVTASSSSTLICLGANTTLNASVSGGVSPFTYAWSPTTWLSCPGPVVNCSSPTANPPTTINYNTIVTDAAGCSASSSVTVNVDNMNVGALATPPIACLGANVTLNANVIGGSTPYTYLWMPGSVSTATYTVVATTAAATYSITATDPNGCSASTTANVNTDNLSTYLQPRTTICANAGGAPGTPTSGLQVQVMGGAPPFSYSWNTGNTTQFLSFQGLSSGIYSVTVTDGNNCTSAAVDTLTVNPLPNIIITSSKNPIQIGWVDTLTASGGIGYAWSTGATTSQIIVNPRISTEYSVVGWNSYYCSSNVSTTIIVSRDYFLPSPDTLIPHLTGFPPIYYDGNVSIGGDSAYSPTQALQVHGNVTIDSNLTVKGNIYAGNIIAPSNDTITVSVIRTHRVAFFPGDTAIHVGDSSLWFDGHNYLRGLYGGIGIGYGVTPVSTSIAIGTSNKPEKAYSICMGYGLSNNIEGSIMMGGYKSTGGIPALSIIPDITNNTFGFVGVGTTTPNAYFNIQTPQSLSANPFTITNYQGNDMIDFTNDQGGSIELGGNGTVANTWSTGTGSPYIDFHYGTLVQNYNVRIINSDNNRMDFVTSSGGAVMSVVGSNVGIGTSAPISPLNIYCNLATNDVGTSTPYQFTIFNNNCSGIPDNTTLTGPNNVLGFDQNGDAYFAGEVLIGDPAQITPFDFKTGAYALNVYGVIRSQEIKVCVTGCDFVFDEGYKLMPLKDLESYINSNHHLPGIASAKEMENGDGVELGKMNTKLLQKVEELTLYTIELKKQLDEMQVEIAKLKQNK